MAYPFSTIESKWQKYWEENKTFKTVEDKNYPKDKRLYHRIFLLEIAAFAVAVDKVAQRAAPGFNFSRPGSSPLGLGPLSLSHCRRSPRAARTRTPPGAAWNRPA